MMSSDTSDIESNLEPYENRLSSRSYDVIKSKVVASAVMCNLTLPFCGPEPFGRQALLQEGLLNAVFPLMTSQNPQLR